MTTIDRTPNGPCPVMSSLHRHLAQEEAYAAIDAQREAWVEEQWQGSELLEFIAYLTREEDAELCALLRTDPLEYGKRCQQFARRNLEREAERKFPYTLIFLQRQAD